MGLPKNELPTFTTKVPSTGQIVTYRPFKVKEQRNLLTAIDGSREELYRVMCDYVDECTFNALDIKNLPNFDIEYLFVQIRIMSIGEITKVDITCPHCDYIDTKDLNLKETVVENLNDKKNTVLLSDTMGIEMRYPSLEEVGRIEDSQESDVVFNVIKNCILRIYDGESVSERTDFNDDELSEWLGNCTDAQFTKIEDFIVNSPYLIVRLKSKCVRCENETEFELRGIQSFFE